MLSRGRLIFIFLSLATVFLVLGGTLLASTAGQEEDDGQDSMLKYLSVFTEVLGLVQRAYVDETDIDDLMAGAYEGAIDALDPFSLYIPPGQEEAFAKVREVGTSRSGLLVLKERGVTYAAAVEEGSPAAEAGIERGDVISEIDGRSTRDVLLWEAHRALAGEPGTEVEVEYLRLGVKAEVKLVLGEYPKPGVELEVKEGAPVLKIHAFHAETPKNVAVSLDALHGETPLEGLKEKSKLLIDVRGVAGGDEEAAYEVAGFFTRGELGVLASRAGVVEVFESSAEPRFTGKIVVLIDRGTQGAAEVLTTVLHQNAAATVVGQSVSFGHSGRQKLVKLSNGARLLLTDTFFTGPDREPIAQSIEPDVVVRPDFPFAIDDDEDADKPDEVLDKALDVLLSDEDAEEEKVAA